MIKPTTPTVNKLMYILLGDGHSRLGYYESPGDFPHLLSHVYPHHGSILDVRVGTQKGLELSWRHLPRKGNKFVNTGTQQGLKLSWRHLPRKGNKFVNTGTQQGLKLSWRYLQREGNKFVNTGTQ